MSYIRRASPSSVEPLRPPRAHYPLAADLVPHLQTLRTASGTFRRKDSEVGYQGLEGRWAKAVWKLLHWWEISLAMLLDSELCEDTLSRLM